MTSPAIPMGSGLAIAQGAATNAGSLAAAAAPGSDQAKIAKVAKQFEAIFIRQMLAEARKTSFNDGLFGGQGDQTFREMQDSRFADIAAEKGTFGMAKMIERQLLARSNATMPAPVAPAAAGTRTGG